MKTIGFESNFQVAGINVTFEERVFTVHTPDDQLFDLVCSYLQTEGFFEECIELYGENWGINQID